MKKKRGRPRKEGTVIIYMRLSKPVAAALASRADREKRSRASVTQMILEAALFTAVAR
jgi:hypothetical protein